MKTYFQCNGQNTLMIQSQQNFGTKIYTYLFWLGYWEMSIFGPGLINKYVPLLLTRLITKFLEAYKSQLQGR